mgnify:CR=1 FL=1
MAWATCENGHRHWGPWGAAGLLVLAGGEVLLQLRARWAHLGGTWSVPGGALERRESAQQAALREAHEELRLDAALVSVVERHTARCGGWTYDTFVATAAAGSLRLRDTAESEAHRWVAVDEVPDLRLHPAFRASWEATDGGLGSLVQALARS